jgi:YHS domain-containing protein
MQVDHIWIPVSVETEGSPCDPKEVNAMAIDPVCGMEVSERDAAGKSEHKGKTYYFCSPGCKIAFDKEPEKYVGKTTAAEHGGHGHGQHH